MKRDMFFKIKPTYIVNHVRDIHLQELKDEGIKAIVCDLDNTLMKPYSGEFDPEIMKWIKELQKDFKIAIVSNNLNNKYIQKIQNEVNFPVYGGAIKPLRQVTLRALKDLDVLPQQCAIIGDTFLTDIVLGLRLGMITVLVDSLVKKGEPIYWQLVQRIERAFIKSAQRTFSKKHYHEVSHDNTESLPITTSEKIAVIFNSDSGVNSAEHIKKEIQKGFEDCKIFEITSENDPCKLAQKALKEGYKTIVAGGGDGTVKAVISAIFGHNVKLGIIPTGTGNLTAANLGIPTHISDAIKVIKEGITRKIDVGKLNNHYVIFMAGCGLNAKVMKHTTREKKKHLGTFAYYIEGFKCGFTPEYYKFKIKIDNKKLITVKASTLLIANAADIFGEVVSMAPEASFYDGKMDLIVVSVFKRIDYLYVFLSVLKRRHFKKSSRMEHYKFNKLEVTVEPSLYVQIDGDVLDKTPFNVKVIHEAVKVIVPS